MSRQFFSDCEKQCLHELIIKYELDKSVKGNQYAKKIGWVQLTEEFNAMESHSKRTENQLKKCWDNMKTRQKALLLVKQERMWTGGGAYGQPDEPQPGSSMSEEIMSAEAFTEHSDMGLGYANDSDSLTQGLIEVIKMEVPEIETEEEDPSQEEAVYRGRIIETPPRHSESLLTDSTTIIQAPKNIRIRPIQEQSSIRVKNFKRGQKREDKLHQFKLKEKRLIIMAAEENFKKAKIERQSAEETLKKVKLETESVKEIFLLNKAKREKAELELINMKKNT